MGLLQRRLEDCGSGQSDEGNGQDSGWHFVHGGLHITSPGDMKVLGAHMLEVCESIADKKPSLEIHPLSIGGKADPVRSVFTAPSGPGVVASIVDPRQ